jgi:hypothetical protein
MRWPFRAVPGRRGGRRAPVQRYLRVEFGQPPGGACGGVGGGVGAGRQRDRDVIRRGRVLAQAGDGGGDLGELAGIREVDREEPVVAGGAAQRPGFPGEPGDPDRHAGPLHRAGEELDAVDGVTRAAMVHRPAGPGGGEDLQRLIQHLAALPVVELLAGCGELGAEAVAAQPGPEGEPPAAELVQGRGFPGDLGRPTAGQRRGHRPEPQPLCDGGGRRQGDPRVGHLPHRRVPAQVIPDEEPVPAGFLGLGGQPGHHQWVGELVEDRQPQRRAQPGPCPAFAGHGRSSCYVA